MKCCRCGRFTFASTEVLVVVDCLNHCLCTQRPLEASLRLYTELCRELVEEQSREHVWQMKFRDGCASSCVDKYP